MAGVTGDLLARHFGGEFRWGRKDCCTAACDAFAELWGIDPMASLRGRYQTRADAEALIDGKGGLFLLAIDLAGRCGLVWRREGRAGDIAIVEIDGRWSLGLALGDGRFAAKGLRGLAVVDRAEGCWGMP